MSETRVDLDARLQGLAETLGRVEATLNTAAAAIAALNATVPHLATKAELAGLRGELATEIATLRGQTTTDFASLRGEMIKLELRLVLWLGGVVVAAAGALFAALHHWPPH
jgi:hypothetical protein